VDGVLQRVSTQVLDNIEDFEEFDRIARDLAHTYINDENTKKASLSS
jgi:hypothetical protein